MVKITAIMKPIDKSSIKKDEFEFSKTTGQVRNTKLAIIKGLRTIFEKNLVNKNKAKHHNTRAS